MSVVIVVPTYNELENVATLLRAVREHVPYADVLVVDDSSPDGTAEIVEKTAVDLDGGFGRIDLIVRPTKQGLGSAYREGFTAALARGYGVVVSMDVDLSHDPRVIPAMLALLDSGSQAVIGSRYVPGGCTVAWPLHRRILSRWGNRYTSIVLRLGVADCTSGFRAYDAAALRSIQPASTTAEGYAFLTELVLRFVRRGYQIAETPIVFTDRRYGTSKMSGRIVAESMWLVTSWAARDLLVRARDRLLGRLPRAR